MAGWQYSGLAGYLRTGKGVTRALTTFLTFCGAVSMSSSTLASLLSASKFYNFTCWTAFVLSIPLLLIHGLGVPRWN